MSDNVVKIFPHGDRTQRENRLRWLVFSAILLLLLALIAWFLLSQSTRLDGVKRFFRYLGKQDEYGSFSFDTYGLCSYALVDDSFALANQNGLTLYNRAGEQTAHLAVQLDAPALKSAGSRLLLYDIGGSALYVYAAGGAQLYALTLPAAIYDADLTADGESCVLYAGSDCRAVLEVYSANGELRYRRKSKQQYLSLCALAPDAHTAAVATLSQQEIAFQSSVAIYPTQSEQESAALDLGGELPSALRYLDDERLCAVGESTLSFLSQDGELLNRYSPENDALLFCCFGADGYVSALYDTYAEQNRYRLMLFSPDGESVAAAAVSDAPLSVSAAGRYTAVLSEQALYIYDRGLALCASTQNTGFSNALVRTDGTALLLGDGAAVLFIPK